MKLRSVRFTGTVRDLEGCSHWVLPSAYVVGERGCTSLRLVEPFGVLVNERYVVPLARVAEAELVLHSASTDSFPCDRPGTAQDGNPGDGKAAVASRSNSSSAHEGKT